VRGPGEILLISTYELGHVPQGVAVPWAHLEQAGYAPAALDLAVDPLDLDRLQQARLVAVSVPMHTALRLGLAAAARIRALAPDAVLCFHGLYAPLNADLLLDAGASAVLGIEAGPELVALAGAVERGEDLSRFVHRGPDDAPPRAEPAVLPVRDGLPPLERYARLDRGDGSFPVAGYVEATRGCKHRCRHCPVVPLYQGRFFAVPEELVVADVAAQVEAGARHVTFGDPDFLNGPTHALRIARALHARFPDVTFDFTAKVEHLVRLPDAIRELAALGAAFATTAVESLSDRVLAALAKGHTRADALRVFALCREAALPLRPSLVPFTPWSTLEDHVELLDVLEAEGLLPGLDPVQLSIRLLVPPGSLLAGDPGIAFDGLDPAALTWRWRHPDPRMDRLQARIAAEVEAAASAREEPLATIARVKVLSLAEAGLPHGHVRTLAPDQRRVPRLTESWFC
jgi:hypothetical protein